jgi:hypothetical protein
MKFKDIISQMKSFHKRGGFFHKLSINTKIVTAAILISIVTMFQSVKAQSSETIKSMEKYTEIVKIIDKKSGNKEINLSEYPDLIKVSNELIKNMREDVYRYIAKEKFDAALDITAAMYNIGSAFGDKALMAESEVMKEELWGAIKLFGNKNASNFKRELTKPNAKTLDALNITITGIGWEYSQKIDGEYVSRALLIDKGISQDGDSLISARLSNNLPVKISLSEVTTAVMEQTKNLDNITKDAIIDEIIARLKENNMLAEE